MKRAFLMDHNEAVMLGFIHPDHESDSVIAAIGARHERKT